MFDFQTFKDLAEDINKSDIKNTPQLIKLFSQWELIEAREFYNLCLGRLETIDKFEKYINDPKTKEVGGDDSIHNFLVKFPWILEPRLSSLEDEVTYKKLLGNQFQQLKNSNKNRRIDFLCKASSDTLYIIEIKKPSKSLNEQDWIQLMSYYSFIKKNLGQSQRAFSYVRGYLIGKIADENVKTLSNDSKDLNCLTYNDMLSQARKYHEDFIKKYKEFKIEISK